MNKGVENHPLEESREIYEMHTDTKGTKKEEIEDQQIPMTELRNISKHKTR